MALPSSHHNDAKSPEKQIRMPVLSDKCSEENDDSFSSRKMVDTAAVVGSGGCIRTHKHALRRREDNITSTSSHSLGTTESLTWSTHLLSTPSTRSFGKMSTSSFGSVVPESTLSLRTRRVSLEEMTIDKLRFHKVGLVGRDEEARVLRNAYQTTIRGHEGLRHRSLVLIEGAAGTGKSRLAEHVLQPLVDAGGGGEHSSAARPPQGALLLKGKQPQQGKKLYAAVSECCEDLAEQVLTTFSLQKIKDLQVKLQEEVGPETPILTAILPSLKPLMGGANISNATSSFKEPQCNQGSFHASGTRNYMEAKLRFKHAFRRFIRIICGFIPIVLLVDDLQWCDEVSFQLLESILHDKQNSRLLIVGTVRKDEATMNDELDNDHADDNLFATFDRNVRALASQSGGMVHVSNIALGNLSLQATVQILEELLSTPGKETILPLAKCVHSKTLGNAFYTVQFLTSLHRRELIKFNLGTLTWSWDVEEINHETTATENVADLVRFKMEALPSGVKSILPLMASLGSVFRLDLFYMVYNHHIQTAATAPTIHTINTTNVQQESIHDSNRKLGGAEGGSNNLVQTYNGASPLKKDEQSILMICVEEGLIEVSSKDSFRWIHDKVEEAALTMVPESQLESMQFDLASSLFEQMNDEQKMENISVLVYLFRTSEQRLSPQDSLSRAIVELKLESGLLAFRSSAFVQAAGEFAMAIEMLAPNAWEVDYGVCLELYSTAAEANLVLGNFEYVDKYISEIELNTEGKPLIHRQRAYDARLRRYMASGRDQEAASFSISLLRKVMDRNFGKRGVVLSLVRKLISVRKNVQVNVDTLSWLPSMSNEMKDWSMVLLDNLIYCLYHSGNPLLPLAVLTALELTLEDGISEVSPTTVVGVGGLICAAFPKHADTGVLYAEQALNLLDNMDFKRYEARTCFAAYYMVLHHSHHIRDLQKGLLRGYKAGMAHGDSDMAFYCMSAYLQFNFEVGAVFDILARDCKFFIQETDELNMRARASIVECVWQSVSNLQGKSKDPLVLTGDVMSEEEWVTNNTNGPKWELFLGRYQLHVAVILGDFERAMEVILNYRFHQGIFEKTFVNAYTMYWLYFHMTIAAASMARRCKGTRYYHKLTKKLGQQIIKWSGNGNPNIQHRLPLVLAELADLSGRKEKAKKHFERAIVSSSRSGFRMDCAMAHERCADFHCRQNDFLSAEYHYLEAVSVYSELGVMLKVKRLEKSRARCSN